MKFRYQARTPAGKIVRGTAEVDNESAVLLKIRTLGFSPVSIERERERSRFNIDISLRFSPKRVGVKDLSITSRQMATMLAAGITLVRALTILTKQSSNEILGAAYDDVRRSVEEGSSLSEAFAQAPAVFPPLMVHLVRAGEAGGFLDRALESVAETFEADLKLQQTVKSAMTYPMIVLLMAVIAVAAMLIFIVPVFQKMFAGLDAALPVPTQILINLSGAMVWIGPLIIVLALVGSAWWRRNRHTPRVRKVVEPVRLKIPVFGALLAKVAIARFARTFGMMTGSGVPILQSLAIVGETSGNWVIENALKNVQDSVRAGGTITDPLSLEPVFPDMVVQMIAVGEDSGTLQLMLLKIADFYDAEVQATTEALASLIEPLMIGIIGAIVGGMIITLYLPMFTIYNSIH